MINIYTPSEIEKIRQGGKILGDVLQKVLARATPGITTLDLDKYADELIVKNGASPSFKMEEGYKFATCMNVNDMVVHGIPTNYKLQDGDTLGVDIGAYYQGFHTDTSWSVEIGKDSSIFLEVGKKALNLAIQKCIVGNHTGDISQAIQETIEAAGYSCVKQLVGHGVGRSLHEDPEIPCYLRGKIENTPILKEGMVLAVEAIYNMGESKIVYANDDGWTIVTKDGFPSGLFEHTVVVTKNGPEILTIASGS